MNFFQSSRAKINLLQTQFLRYFLVGGGAFVVDFTVLYTLTEFAHLHYLLAAAFALITGTIVNYGLCIIWVFDHRNLTNRAHEFFIFTMVGIAGLLLNSALMWLFTELIGFHYLASKSVSAVTIFTFNFGARRTLLFSGRKQYIIDTAPLTERSVQCLTKPLSSLAPGQQDLPRP